MRELERKELEEIMAKKVTDFWGMFYALCMKKELSNSAVYCNTPYDRKYFHKQTKKEAPQRDFVMWMTIGLKLNLKEATELLAKAGYTFSDKIIKDRIFKFYIEHEIYERFEIDDSIERYCPSKMSP